MTLALYGKSRRRQLSLIIIGIFAALVGVAGGLSLLGGEEGAQAAPHASVLMSDNFNNAAEPDTVPNWTDFGGDENSDSAIRDDYLRLRSGGGVYRTVTTTGYTSIRLNYTWGQQTDGGGAPGPLVVRWRVGSPAACNTGTWNTVGSHNLANNSTTASNANSVEVDLGAAAANTSITLCFWANTGTDDDDRARVDNVVVSGLSATTGTITIIKDVAGGTNAQDFAYTTTGGLNPSTFSLDDDNNNTLSNTQTFNNVNPGAYSVTETPAGGNWALTSLVCTDTTGNSSGNNITGTATINLAAGDVVVCTFTNSMNSFTTVLNQINGATVPNPSFTGTCGPADFNIVIDSSSSVGGDYVDMETNVRSFITAYEAASQQQGLYALTVYGTAASLRTNYITGAGILSGGNDALWNQLGGTQYTNTDDAIRTALTATGGRTDVPRIMFVITDGAPNTWQGGSSSPTLTTSPAWLEAANRAIVAADLARTAPDSYHIKAIYVDLGNDGDTNMSWVPAATDRVLWSQKVMTGIGNGVPSSLGTFNALLDELLVQSGCSDLIVSKSVSDPTPEPGDPVTYTVQVSNNGQAAVANATITDPLPGTGIFNWAIVPVAPASCSVVGTFPAAQSLTCTGLPSIAPQGSLSVAVTTTVPTGQQICTTYNNVATLDYIDDAQQPVQKSTDTISFTVEACQQFGTLQVKKIVVGDATGAPEFTGTVSGQNPWGNLPDGFTTYTNVPAGQVTVAEDNFGPTWALTGYATAATAQECPLSPTEPVAPSFNATVPPNGNIAVCVYNAKVSADLVIKKLIVGPQGPAQAFGGTLTGQANWSVTPNDAGQSYTGIPQGQYTIAETAPASPYEFVGYIKIALAGTCPAAPSQGDFTSTNISYQFDLAAAGAQICVYNRVDTGTIIINKVAVGGNDTFPFFFNSEGFDLTTPGSATATYNNLVPDSYNVTELPKAGWALTGLTCDDGNSGGTIQTGIASISLQPGETVTCTFTNTKLGSISGTKWHDLNGDGDADGGEAGIPSWNINLQQPVGSTIAGPTPTDGDGEYSFTSLLPGNYRVCEAVVAGWQNISPVCVDVTLAAGENKVDVDFFNRQLGTIIIRKATTGGNGTFNFTAPTLDNDGFSLTVPGDTSESFLNVAPGIHNVTEIVPEGWDLTSINCGVGQNNTAAVDGLNIVLEAGETVDCTFNNVLGSPLVVTKTGAGFYDKTVTWTISKIADDIDVQLADDGNQNVNYDVDVDETVVYSDIYVAGTFTVHNPNNFPVTVNNVSDSLVDLYDGNISCTLNGVSDPVPAVIPANGDYICTYETNHVLLEGAISGVNNTASVVAANPALSDTSDVLPITFSLADLFGPDTINVDDDKGSAGNWIDLGSADTDKKFEYTQNFKCDGVTYVDGVGQKTITNIARIVETGQEATEDVVLTCTQRRGSVTLNKIVEWGNTVNHPANPSFGFCITGPSYPNIDDIGACQATTGGAVTWLDLIPGMYMLHEVNIPAGWVTSLLPNPTLPFMVDPAEAVDRGTVTNTYRPGSLEVFKVVNLQGADPTEAPENSFEICISGPSYDDVPSCKFITGGSSATWEGLLPGVYHVMEKNQSSEWTVTYTGDVAGSQQNTVDNNEAEDAEVKNTLKLGDLLIGKTFDWDEVPVANQPPVSFLICITGPSYDFVTDAGACKSVVNATATVSWTGLIPGLYTIVELDLNGDPVDDLPGWVVTGNTSVQVDPGQTAGFPAATVINTYQRGGFAITKEVDWGSQTPDLNQTFNFCAVGPSFPIAPGECKSVQHGDIWALNDLIPGDYVITEDNPGPEWFVSNNGVTVKVPAGGTGEHKITNTILEGDLNVGKTINWNGAPEDAAQEFTICILGPSYPSVDSDGRCKIVSPAVPTAQWPDLEVGEYTVSELFEQGDGAEWTTTVDGVDGTTGSANVVSGENAVVEIVNTLKQGRVIVQKVYNFPGGTPDPSWQPVVTVGLESATPDGGLDLWQPVNVPANKSVDVVEQLPDGWINTDISFEGECGILEETQIISDLIESALLLIGLDVNISALELAGASVIVPPGLDCTVIFTNEAVGTVEVTKNDNTVSGGPWNFELDGPGEANDEAFSIDGDGTESRSPVPTGEYSVVETNAGAYESIDQCPIPNPNGEGVYTSVVTPNGTVIDEPGETISFVFTNTSCPVVLATGTLIIEKWEDFDGDGDRDASEDPVAGWDITVSGPQFPGGSVFSTDASGQVILPGILAGFYTVSEENPTDWYVTGLWVDGVKKNAVSTTQAEVKDDSLEETLDTLVEFGNRRTASIRVIKIVNDQVGNATREGWVFTVTGCGIFQTDQTDASGEILWEGLKPCQYLVRESQADQDGFTTSPSAQQSVNPGTGETAVVTFTNQRVPDPTPSLTPPTATPTNTPVPPTATPTNTPATPEATDTPTPVETTAGEITPGPGNQATPIPPDTGTGFGTGTNGSNLLLLIFGMAAVTAGACFISLARKRN